MIRSYSQILGEVSNAVDYVRAQGGNVPWNAIEQQIEAGKQMTDLSDNATLEGWFQDELPSAPPNVIRATTAEELAMVYQALGYIHGGIDPHKIDKDITHEKAHKAQADFIGFRQSVLGLTLTDSSIREIPIPNGSLTEVRFGWRAFSEQAGPLGRVTKLAVASMVAAPYRLSEGDLSRLNAMGYKGQEDVAERIIAATDSRLSTLPLPEPFSPR